MRELIFLGPKAVDVDILGDGWGGAHSSWMVWPGRAGRGPVIMRNGCSFIKGKRLIHGTVFKDRFQELSVVIASHLCFEELNCFSLLLP